MAILRILYITKLKGSQANGVTNAVTQLLSSICNYAEIGWIDLNNINIEVNKKVQIIDTESIIRFNPDIAIFEDPFNSLFYCKIARMLRDNGIPYVLSPHGCFTKIALQKNSLKKFIAMKTVLRSFLNGCKATQFLCTKEKDNSIIFQKPIIIPNGIFVSENFRVVKTIKNIVFIGRKDVRHKGLDFLLRAVKIEEELFRSKGVRLFIYGPTESKKDEHFIDKYIEENKLNDIVINNGPIFDKIKEDVLLNSDLFILTSRHEGFPLSILEALSYGLPVLISNGTNMQDIILSSDSGWACETDSLEISRQLKEAILFENIKQKSKNARNLSLRYSWSEISYQTVEAYTNLIQS